MATGFRDTPSPGPRARTRDLAAALTTLVILAACGGGSGVGSAGTGGTGVPPSPTPLPTSGGVRLAAAPRDHPLTRTTLGPWWGSGCPKNGDCGCGSSETLAQEFECQMDEIRANDLPISVYLFDGAGWSERDSRVEGTCSGPDCCSWNLGEGTIARLEQERVRALVHFWGGCHEPEQYARIRSQLGGTLLGFYLDDGSSDAELKRVNDYMRSVAPGDFENIAKSPQSREPATSDPGLSSMANVSYVGDVRNDFEGLRDGITRFLQKVRLLPAPVNEFTGYDYVNRNAPSEETYFRRLHWGAFQPVMAHTAFGNSDPWRSEYSGDLLAAYRYYAWLHKELTPYFLSYAQRMHGNSDQPILQAGPGPYAMRVGEEIFVPFVTDPTPTISVELPPGQWIDYWDEERVVEGSIGEQRAPLGQEPVFLKLGAIIPLEVERDYAGHGTRESAGSLTVLVYPSGASTFRYFDDDNGNWTTFRSVVNGAGLTLSADSGPRMPVIYRVGRMTTRPTSVAVNGRTVLVNQSGSLREAESEAEVNDAATSAWYYDEIARRLIVKVVP